MGNYPTDNADKVKARADNVPLTAKMQSQILALGRQKVGEAIDGMLAYEGFNDATKNFIANNCLQVELALSAPIEAALFGVTSEEIIHGQAKRKVMDAEPAENFAQLKEKLKTPKQNMVSNIAKSKKMSVEQQGFLQEMYTGLSLSLIEAIEEQIQANLPAPGRIK